MESKSQYKSDGLIKLFNMKNLELLLSEAPGCFDNKDKLKLNFDHHKSVFGALTMLKCIADDYRYASIDQFTKVKVFILNAASKTLTVNESNDANFWKPKGAYLHLWSLCYQKESIFDFWRESSLLILLEFDNKQDFIPDLIKFCLNTKVIL